MPAAQNEADGFAFRHRKEPLFSEGDTVVGHYLRTPVSTPDYLATELAEGTVTAVHLPAADTPNARPSYDVLSLVFLNQYVDIKTDSNVPEEQLMLERRGNVWKHAHGVPVVFKTVNEEAAFWLDTGDVREVRKPFGTKRWTKRALIKALQKGTIDIYEGPSGARTAYAFNDREVGERVRAFMVDLLLDSMPV